MPRPTKKSKQPSPSASPTSSQATGEAEEEEDDSFAIAQRNIFQSIENGIQKKRGDIIREAKSSGQDLFERFTHAVEVTHHAQLIQPHQTHLTRLRANQAKYQTLLQEFTIENKAANTCQNNAMEGLKQLGGVVGGSKGYRATCERVLNKRDEMNAVIGMVGGRRKRPRKSDDTVVPSDQEF